MQLSDFFPLQPGQPFLKQHLNLLIAAAKERFIKNLKFAAGIGGAGYSCGGVPVGVVTTPSYISSNSDTSTQSYLDFLFTFFSEFSVMGHVLRYLPYEDYILGGYSFNSSLRKITWSIDLTPTSGYEEKNLIFCIKDASLYFIRNGQWEKDAGQVIILQNDIILLRFFTEVSSLGEYFTKKPLAFPDCPVGDIDYPLSALDSLFFFKTSRDSSIGGNPDLNGDILSSNVPGQPNVFSPYLIYNNSVDSSIFQENNIIPYKAYIESSDTLDNINENYMFLISPQLDAGVVDLFPFIADDYFLSTLYPYGLLYIVMWKNNSYTNRKPNYTASLINSLYYLVDYMKYVYDKKIGTTVDCACNGVSLSVSYSVSLPSLLATYDSSATRSHTTTLAGACPLPGDASLGASTSEIPCTFGGSSVSSSASAAGVFGVTPGVATTTSTSTITSSNMVWKRSVAGFTISVLGTYNAGTSCEVVLDATSVLEIK